MRSQLRVAALVSTLALTSAASPAFAHVALSGDATVGKSALLTFGVGHGCEGSDSTQIEVAIPKEVVAVRAAPSVFGTATLIKDDTGIVTAVRWTKQDAREEDDQYYQLSIRITVPDLPFTTLYFPTRQTCRNAEGDDVVVDWAALPSKDAAASQAEDEHPAPAVTIFPQRRPGWNKFTMPAKLDSLGLFDDAQIVWSGDAAYSSNPTTAELIKADDSVDELTALKAGAEIWVKY